MTHTNPGKPSDIDKAKGATEHIGGQGPKPHGAATDFNDKREAEKPVVDPAKPTHVQDVRG